MEQLLREVDLDLAWAAVNIFVFSFKESSQVYLREYLIALMLQGQSEKFSDTQNTISGPLF